MIDRRSTGSLGSGSVGSLFPDRANSAWLREKSADRGAFPSKICDEVEFAFFLMQPCRGEQ